MNASIKSYIPSPSLKKAAIALIITGVVTFLLTLKSNSERAWANYLLGYFFWMNIGFAGLFFTALQHITGSMWSAPIRRVAEALSSYLPYSLILFIGILVGHHQLFEWTHAEVVAKDPLLLMKSAYLNLPFFVVRHLALYALAFTIGKKLRDNSLEQDKAPNAELSLKNVRLSAPFLMLFAVLYTLAAIDLIMSLSPHWFSTIFGLYCWSGLFYSGLAMIMLWTLVLRDKGVLIAYVKEDHIHDLAKLMFAFLVFWAYIAFSQYILIWYANLPEETPYYITRTLGAYAPVSLLLVFGKFIIPLFLLISRPVKLFPSFLKIMCIWFFVAQWIDCYWMIFPNFFKEPVFGLNEIGIFAGFAGVFLASVPRYMSTINMVAINDPWMEDALHHHNNPNAY